jgi:hypothetical protein
VRTQRRGAGERAGSMTTALAAASALRSAAELTDPTRRAEAVWDGLGRLSPSLRWTASVVDRLEDDGRGDVGVPGPRVLLATARQLEGMAATARGMDGREGPDPGRIRRPALRADRPTTRQRTRRRHRRRLCTRGRPVR